MLGLEIRRKMKIQVDFNSSREIFYKYYSGEVSFYDFEKSWYDLIRNSSYLAEVKGFLLDYRNATLALPLNELYKISDFFLSHKKIFGDKKIAFVATTPEQVIIPVLVGEQDNDYQIRPFSTIEAAEHWIIA